MTSAPRVRYRLVVALLSLFATGPAWSTQYTLGVQPNLDPDATERAYAPLAKYLSDQTGHDIQLVTSRDFYSFWTCVQRGDYDITLGASHFTGYQIKRLHKRVIARFPDTLSFSLVTTGDTPVTTADGLVGKPVAVAGPPSMGALRLERMFPNPMREPRLVAVNDAGEAMRKVLSGDAAAAVVPTPMLADHPDLRTVMTTEATPDMAFSVDESMPPEVIAMLRDALLSMRFTPRGQELLATLRLPEIASASPDTYLPYASLLESTRHMLNAPTARAEDFIRPARPIAALSVTP